MNRLSQLKQKYFSISLAFFMLMLSTAAFADDSLPWESPLQKILESLTGPVARILGVIAIVIAGFGIAFGEAGSGVRRLFQVILGLSIVYSAAALVMNLFGVSN
jgi:type IV secretory pathway VirB2 component (pilin)